MSRSNTVPYPVATGTAGVQAYTGQTNLVGFSFEENAGTPAAAKLVIRDGTTSSDPAVAYISLLASESVIEFIPEDGIRINVGVFIDKTAGTTIGVVHLG